MLKSMATSLLVLLAIAGAVGLWRGLNTEVTRVDVVGSLSRAEREEVVNTLQQQIDGGFLSISTQQLSESLKRLSWLREVAVRRVWPDALEISVVKEHVVAQWDDAHSLTAAGDLVQGVETVSGVPKLRCSYATPQEALERYRMLSEMLRPERLQIAELIENPLGEWRLKLDSGLQVNLGSEEVGERMQRFLLTYRSHLAERSTELAYVDARYANGVAVAWRNVMAATPAADGENVEEGE